MRDEEDVRRGRKKEENEKDMVCSLPLLLAVEVGSLLKV